MPPSRVLLFTSALYLLGILLQWFLVGKVLDRFSAFSESPDKARKRSRILFAILPSALLAASLIRHPFLEIVTMLGGVFLLALWLIFSVSIGVAWRQSRARAHGSVVS